MQCASGFDHSLLLDHFGGVWGCGKNEDGQLGFGDQIGRKEFQMVHDLPKLLQAKGGNRTKSARNVIKITN